MVGEAAALGSAFLWALSNILMGSQSSRVPAVVISSLRTIFGALFLVAVAAVTIIAGEGTLPSLPRALALAGSGALGMGAGDTLYIRSLRHIGVSRAFPISMAAFPLLTFALAAVWLGEQVSMPVAAGTLLVIGGVVVVVSGDIAAARDADVTSTGSAAELRAGMAMVVVAAVLWALASVWLRTAVEGVAATVAPAVRMPVAALVTVGLVRGSGHSLLHARYRRRTILALLVTGIAGTGIGSMLYVVAVQHAGAARTAVLSSTAPLYALPMAAMALGERVTWRIAAGTLISIVGIWLVIAPP